MDDFEVFVTAVYVLIDELRRQTAVRRLLEKVTGYSTPRITRSAPRTLLSPSPPSWSVIAARCDTNGVKGRIAMFQRSPGRPPMLLRCCCYEDPIL